MNTKLNLQQFQVVFFVQSLCALLLAAQGVASAYVPGTATDNIIKDTNYDIPSDAYYVSPEGNETNSGRTPDSPWSVAKALSSAPNEATIVFRGGTYRNINNAYICKKLTLQPYPHEKAWIKGSDEVTGWVADGSMWRKDNWNYSFDFNLGSEYMHSNYPMADRGDMVYVDGVSLKQVGSKAEVVPATSGKTATFYVDSVNKKLYIGSSPQGKTVQATTRKRAFATGKCGGSSSSLNPSGTVVRGLGFAHFADMAIALGVDRVTLENNTFVWNGMQGVNFLGESDGVLNVSTDATVRGNTFNYNGRKGMAGDRAHRIKLENNTFSYNNIERFNSSWDAAGVKFTRTDGATLAYNTIEHNFSHGGWLDVSSSNAKLVHNIIRYNSGFGIYFEVSHKAIIGANLAHHNGTGIVVSNSSSTSVYNNTLANNGTNVRIKDDPRVNTNSGEIAKGITWIANNNILKNNILSNTGNSNTTAKELLIADILCGSSSQQTADKIPVANYNGYYRTSSSTPQYIINLSLIHI